MKKTIDEQDFIEEFANFNRVDEFSRDALRLLYNHLIEWEDANGEEEEELYVLDLCRRYTELSLLQFVKDYDLDVEDWVDLKDYENEDEFNDDNYLKSISGILTSDCPEEYKDYKILTDRLVTKTEDDGYYRIVLTGIYKEDDWIETSAIYFVTDVDYKLIGTTTTTSNAINIGDNVPSDIFNLTIENKEDKKKTWEDIDENKVKEIIKEYIEDIGDFVGFTNHGTVVFGDI